MAFVPQIIIPSQLMWPEGWPKAGTEILDAVLDCIYEAVCVIDSQGLVRFWNRGAEQLYNVPRGEILNRPITEFFPNALVNRVRLSREAETNIQHRPREGSHILANAMPLSVDGLFMGAVSSDRDYAEVVNLYGELEDARSHLGVLRIEIRKLSEQFADMVGSSPIFMDKVMRAKQIADSNTNVLLSGESGTGKEVFARKIHEISGREGLFVPVNCSAIPPELFESECFGYAPGAFTGASRKGKPGYFEMAEAGTIFLDEIAEMPLSMQAKLLRVLQEREIVRVGGEKPIKLNVRIISACNCCLEQMVREGRFREDLYYRLNVVEISLPALRERKEDIPVLLNHFVREFARKNGKDVAGVLPAVITRLSSWAWPGNIRELMNVAENMVVTGHSRILDESSIPEYIIRQDGIMPVQSGSLNLSEAVNELELRYIREAMRLSRSNKSRAAMLLGMPRASLYHKLRHYGLNQDDEPVAGEG